MFVVFIVVVIYVVVADFFLFYLFLGGCGVVVFFACVFVCSFFGGIGGLI